jgi:abequosyltransferase
MPSKSPLLTIAIPTYNRSHNLVMLLASLAPQLTNESLVELLISDNASSDDTSSAIEAYRRKGMVFRSIRNEINLGADSNIAQCFAEAAGQYVWIVGDDDIVLPGALAVILSLLEQDEYDIVHIRGKDFDNNHQLSAVSPSPQIEIIGDARKFALRTHVFLTFITGNIVNKARVLSLPHRDFSELIGTSLVQLGWTYAALAHFRKGAYIRDSMVAVGADDRGGYALFRVFGTNLKQITESRLVESALVRIVINGTLQTFFPVFVLQSKRGQSTFQQEKPDTLLHDAFASNPRYYFFLYPLLKLPSALGRIWLLICKIINRLDRAIGNPMLR